MKLQEEGFYILNKIQVLPESPSLAAGCVRFTEGSQAASSGFSRPSQETMLNYLFHLQLVKHMLSFFNMHKVMTVL